MDKQSFDARVMAQIHRLHRIACTILPREQDREDAVQEAFIRAWLNLHTLRDDAFFETWLCRIVINECKNLRRRRARAQTAALAADLPAPEPPDPVLAAALRRLDEKYRVPLMLHHVEGYRQEEIAKMLCLPAGTVGWHIHRAKKELAAIMEEAK